MSEALRAIVPCVGPTHMITPACNCNIALCLSCCCCHTCLMVMSSNATASQCGEDDLIV